MFPSQHRDTQAIFCLLNVRNISISVMVNGSSPHTKLGINILDKVMMLLSLNKIYTSFEIVI